MNGIYIVKILKTLTVDLTKIRISLNCKEGMVGGDDAHGMLGENRKN